MANRLLEVRILLLQLISFLDKKIPGTLSRDFLYELTTINLSDSSIYLSNKFYCKSIFKLQGTVFYHFHIAFNIYLFPYDSFTCFDYVVPV